MYECLYTQSSSEVCVCEDGFNPHKVVSNAYSSMQLNDTSLQCEKETCGSLSLPLMIQSNRLLQHSVICFWPSCQTK